MERNRLLWMVLKKFGMFRIGKRILHIAPELAFTMRFSELSGARYHACDLDTERYRSTFVNVRPMDLCTDLAKLPSCSFDLIIHSHVLEHIPCDVETTLRELERVLAPGGRHFLSVPIRGETTQEDVSDNLMPAHRAVLFGQDDHYRIFGAQSLREMFARVWPETVEPLITPRELLSENELRSAAIPEAAWSGYTSHSIFHRVKPVYSVAPDAFASAPAVVVAAAPRTSSNRLLLHIGMPGANCRDIQRWLSVQGALLESGGVQIWRNQARTLFMGFASQRRIDSGNYPFKHLLKSGEILPAPEEARKAFGDFCAQLAGGIGVVSAETLWSFTRDEAQALRDQLAAWNVDARILCFVRQPAAYLTATIDRRVREGLSLEEIGPTAPKSLEFTFARLADWADIFGDASVMIRDENKDPVAQANDALISMGAALTPLDAEDRPAAAPGLVAVKALLAMNEWTRQNGASGPPRQAELLKRALATLGDEKLVLPESVAARMKPTLERESALLSQRFGLALDANERLRMDDHRFLYWTPEDVGQLLSMINTLLLAQESRD